MVDVGGNFIEWSTSAGGGGLILLSLPLFFIMPSSSVTTDGMEEGKGVDAPSGHGVFSVWFHVLLVSELIKGIS